MEPVEIEFLMKDNLSGGVKRSRECVEDLLDTSSSVSAGMRSHLRSLTETIVSTTVEYRRMGAAERESASGVELKRKLETLIKEASELRDAMDDVNRQVRGEASDTKGFDALAQGINVATSAVGGLTGATSLLGVEEERMQELQTKLQATLAISNALTVIQNNLQKESALLMKITAIQSKAAAAAKAMEAKGTVAATIAQKAFNAVAKANPYVLLAGAIISVVGALALFAKASKKSAAEEEALQRKEEEARTYREKYNETLSETIMQYKNLQHEYLRLKSEKEKTQWIQDNTDKFHALGLEINNIKDADNVFCNNTGAVVQAFHLRAQAAAYAAQITRLYSEALAGQKYKVNDKISLGEVKELFGYSKDKDRIELSPYVSMVGGFFSDSYYLTQEGVDYLNSQVLKEAENTAEGLRKQMDDTQQKAKNILGAAGIKTPAQTPTPTRTPTRRIGGSTGGGGGSKWDADKAAKDRERLQAEWYKELYQQLQAENQAYTDAYVDSLEDSTDKILQELTQQEKKQLSEVSERRAKLIEDARQYNIEKWKKEAEGNDEYNYKEKSESEYVAMIEEAAPGLMAALDKRETQIREAASAARKKILDEEAEKQAAALREYEAQYGNYQQRRLALTEKYNKLIADAETEGEKATLSQQLEKELDELDKEIMESSELWSDYFGKFESRSNTAIRGVMSDIQALIAYMNGEGGEIPEAFSSNEKAVEAINAAMADPKATKEFIANLTKTWNTFKKMIDEDNPFKQISEGFKNGDWEQMSKGFKAISDAVGEVQSVMSDLGISEDSAVGKATSIIGDTASYAAQGAQIGGAYGAIAGAALGLVKGMVGIAGTSDPTLIKDIERLTSTNEALIKAVEELSKDMKDASPAQAMEIYRKQVDMLNQNAANTREIMLRSGAAYSNGFLGIGGHGSTNKKINRGMTSAEWAQISSIVGGSVTGASDFWALTQEQMHDVAKYAPVLWAKIKSLADEGLQDVSQYMDAYADGWEAIKEATDALHEKLTGTTRDDVFDDFLSSLYSLADGSADVMDDIADNWQKMVNRMAVNNLVGAKFRERLEVWYEDLSKLNEERALGEITDAEYRRALDALKSAYEGYVSSAESDISVLRSEGIIKDTAEYGGVTQHGKSGAFTTMSQDQGTKLEGLFVSGQMHWSSMDEKLTDVSVQLGSAGDTLKRIEEHTGLCAERLSEIKEEIEIMKRDGLKVK